MPIYAGVAAGKSPEVAAAGSVMVKCPTCNLVFPIPDDLDDTICCGACRMGREVDSVLIQVSNNTDER